MNSESNITSVQLIDQRSKEKRSTTLVYLELVFNEGDAGAKWEFKPFNNGNVLHNDQEGAGGIEMLPGDLCYNLTAEKLVMWMRNNINLGHFIGVDYEEFIKDERVIEWCNQIQQYYNGKSECEEQVLEQNDGT